ncbi:Kiwa anti-phage protein KwaB-like domain-containing protein [Fusobacterium sp.]|uniref:Kiwa anti-phage protein KwaB-like domain-containing protein n=1 Tax=Fusobacterium sp. TaxID=68766 RepID=UPI002E77A740|nr:hypothetical protein [Fusobacterium sp.]MEE1476931.1 hypothetical protein [Fusobacterium sp.]
MGVLVCKIKQNKGSNFEKIKSIYSTEEELYSGISDLNIIKYDPDYKVEENEIFFIDEASKIVKNKEILKDFGKTSTTFTQINSEEWGKVDYLIFSKGNYNYYQRIKGKKYLNHKKVLLFFEGNPQISEGPEGITINPNSHIIYNISEDKLYFKDFNEVNKIFQGVEELYREATNEEIKEFFDIELMERKEEFNISKITNLRRKKILLALHEFKEGKNIDQLVNYGTKYYGDYFTNNKIIIDSNEKIDIVIDIIQEKVYTTEVSNEKRKANSIRKL